MSAPTEVPVSSPKASAAAYITDTIITVDVGLTLS